MTFEEAIEAHCRWRLALAAQLEDPEQPLPELEVVAAVDRCPLGQWLLSEGGRVLSARPEGQALQDQHGRFHATAAEVVRRCAEPHRWRADEAMAQGTAFHEASKGVVAAVKALRDQMRTAVGGPASGGTVLTPALPGIPKP